MLNQPVRIPDSRPSFGYRTRLMGWGLLLGLLGCVDPVALPIRQTQRRLVVDGLITTAPPPYLVKLSYSGQLTSSLLIPDELAINGAQVLITDDAGRSVRLEQDPLNPAFYWARDPTFQGQAGRSYTLQVELPDKTQYQSQPERLAPVPPLDQLTAYYQTGFTELGQPDGYLIGVNTQDPATPGNFYRWESIGYVPRWTKYDPLHQPVSNGPPQFCFCSCWVPYPGPLTAVLSDALINGQRISNRVVFRSPVYAVGNQYIQVRQYSLSQRAYQYWTLFEQQRTRTGSLFDPQPASIEGNVRAVDDTTRLALGYFGASAVSQQRLTIPGDTINYGRFLSRYKTQFIPPDQDCFQAYPQCISSTESGQILVKREETLLSAL